VVCGGMSCVYPGGWVGYTQWAFVESPYFIYSDKEIINMSFSSKVKNPEAYYSVDEDGITKLRDELLKEFGYQME